VMWQHNHLTMCRVKTNIILTSVVSV